jgi:hypothetical protein
MRLVEPPSELWPGCGQGFVCDLEPWLGSLGLPTRDDQAAFKQAINDRGGFGWHAVEQLGAQPRTPRPIRV